MKTAQLLIYILNLWIAIPAISDSFGVPDITTPYTYYKDLIDNQNKNIDPVSRTNDYINASKVPVSAMPVMKESLETIDRSRKLDYAAGYANEGYKAASATYVSLMTTGISLTMNGISTSLTDPSIGAAGAALLSAAGDYAPLADSMEKSKEQNAYGAARVRLDPEVGSSLTDSKSASSLSGSSSASQNGGSSSGAGSSLQASSSWKAAAAREVVSQLDERTKQFFERQGIKPLDFVERLQSGAIDPRNPSAIAYALNSPVTYSGEDLEKGKLLAQKILAGDKSLQALLGKNRNLASEDGKSLNGKDEKDYSLFGIPFPGVSQRNRDAQKGTSLAEGGTLSKRKTRGLLSRTSGKIHKIDILTYSKLSKIGVKVPTHYKNIFQLARNEYSAFRHWVFRW